MGKWREVIIKQTSIIQEAVKVIDQTGLQIAVVVDDDDQLIGTITDGDVRRGFLKGFTLKDSVCQIMNSTPKYALYNSSREENLTMMKDLFILQIPLVDNNKKVVGIETLSEMISPIEKDGSVVLMAGGLGSRLGDLTQDTPKPMLKVGNKPILETIITKFSSYGYKNIFISVNYKPEKIKDFFGSGEKWDVSINYINEKERLGTAGALSLLPEHAKKHPVIVMNGDVLTNVNFDMLLEFHHQSNAKATVCVRKHEFQVPYGVVKVHENNIKKIVEKPVHSFFVNAGIYVLSSEVLEMIPLGEYFDMTTLIDNIAKKDSMVSAFALREYWLDVGHKDDLDRANGDYQEFFG